MQRVLPTVILRHRKENLKKCTLRGLEDREDMYFYTYPQDELPCLDNFILLDVNAPLLSGNDCGRGLFLIDATWRYTKRIAEVLENQRFSKPLGGVIRRSLPPFITTAYPRRQEDCPDPSRGLASIEALYTAYCILGRNPGDLLDGYCWKDRFLEKNEKFFVCY